MSWYDQLVGLFVFFTILNTITVGLRLLVRTRLIKGSFGWDDTALVFTYYYYAMCIVCFIISGTVKISVAFVLYRLTNNGSPLIRAVIIFDISTCWVWTIFTTALTSLSCMKMGPYYGAIDKLTCTNVAYSRESLYVIYDVFHIILPVFILWNVQIGKGLKWSVLGLFSLGVLATIAAAMKLKLLYDGSQPHSSVDPIAQGYKAMIWSIVEHGLSIFASSVLALRPLIRWVSSGWATLSSTLYGSSSGSAKPSVQNSSRHILQEPHWSRATETNELSSIGVRNEVSIRTEHTTECPYHLQTPLYLAEAYGICSKSH
ncbi:hypothetical protein KVR01_012700 [Diaporthe batatas]|uniref:uncharacterized protein n=1 Tax=Diaporthe batatas TaxID=748121 RepID=UPI001D03E90E|nr:uncharacterized protein KVR01_012700 [Diaporthe batatas]KAG8157316.1 hypothetical protein KVR01_012700 [Diaporthe batatas]